GAAQSQAAMFPMRVLTGSPTPNGTGTVGAGVSLFADVIPGIGRNLGLAIANPSNGTNTFFLALRDQKGGDVAQASITLQPQQQAAQLLSDIFPADVIGPSFQ